MRARLWRSDEGSGSKSVPAAIFKIPYRVFVPRARVSIAQSAATTPHPLRSKTRLAIWTALDSARDIRGQNRLAAFRTINHDVFVFHSCTKSAESCRLISWSIRVIVDCSQLSSPAMWGALIGFQPLSSSPICSI